MISYLLKVWVLLMFSSVIIFFYYKNGAHIENFDGYFIYIVLISLIYGVYKYAQLISFKNKVEFTPIQITGYFFVHLVILAILFSYYNGIAFGDSFINGVGLSFKILFYSVLPAIIIIISMSFGQKILGLFLEKYENKSPNYKAITGIGIGFFSFISILVTFGFFGFYNIFSVFFILIFFTFLSYKEILNTLNGIINYKIKCTDNDIYSKNMLERINPKLLSTEFLFIVITLLLSVNLISIFRPFPIGWDDLGSYMNYAHLMASSGSIGELGTMLGWQTFTGIGYMFNNPTLAFFFNNVGGFVSVIVISLIISEIFKNKKETFINLPLLASTIFISMPMIVFQQAKDMKLDAGLFFISIIALYMLFDFYKNYKDDGVKKEEFLSKSGILKLFFVIGLLLGFAFTIKFTGLLLISAIIGILFFTRLGILGFLGYLSIYFAIFTKLQLWEKMNVITETSNEFNNSFFLIGMIVGISLLITARKINKKRFRRFLPRVGVLILGIIIAISPWAINNMINAEKIGLSEMLYGKAHNFKIDYRNIYSEKELENIERKTEMSRGINSSGTTSNEDFGRYFGNEKGINNYVKLPWNLTMQKNQGGEFTDIGFLFLALLPSLLLFLPFRKKEFSIGVYTLLFFEILLFIIPQTREMITIFMTGFSLPFGYILILLLFLLPLVFLIPTLQKEELSKLFKINLIFTVFYTFLWGISAFGIVWYGIVMYFNFILMIIFGVYYLGSYNIGDKKEIKNIRFFGTLIFFTIVCVYIFMNIFPHTFNNLKKAGYPEYKRGNMNIQEAPFLYHKEYLVILFNLNISEEKKEEFISNSIELKQLKDFFKKNNVGKDISLGINLLNRIISDKTVSIEIRGLAEKSIQNIYSGILEPSKEFKNNVGIYRIGTFLKYYISENNKRLYGDNLVKKFDKYIYNKDVDITVERMKKIGLKYLLVDLNGATIDKSLEHSLTKRYEKLLKTFTSKKLELIDTDSICLKIGLENYTKEKSLKTYMYLGGVNYDGYDDKGNKIGRNVKKLNCLKSILELIKANQINSKNYNYLIPLISPLEQFKTEKDKIQFLFKYVPSGYKVLFKIK